MDLQELIAQARAEGYSDSEIARELSAHPTFQATLKEGFKPGEVHEALGLKPLPGKFGPEIEAAAKKYNLDPRMLWAVAQQESGGKPEAVGQGVVVGGPRAEGNVQNARGLMQLMPDTAKALGVTDPHDPIQSLEGGAKLLRQNLDRYNGDIDKALKSYHGGYDVAQWRSKTNAYPGAVYKHWESVGGTPTKVGDLAQGPEWDAFQNLANGYLQGAGVPLKAASTALKEGFAAYKQGKPAKEAISDAVNFYYPQAKSTYEASRQAYKQDSPVAAFTSELGGSATSGSAALAATGIPALVSAAGGIANPLIRWGAKAAGGALEGGAQGAMSSGLNEAPADEQTALGAGVNALTRSTIGPAVSSLWNRTLGSSIEPTVAKTALTASNAGIPVRVGQLEGAPPLAAGLDKVFGQLENPSQRSAFTRGISKSFGMNTDSITTPVIEAAQRQNGQTLERIAAGKIIPGNDTALFNALTRIGNEVDSHIGMTDGEKAGFKKLLNKVDRELMTGGLTGESYRELVKNGSTLSTAIQSRDPSVKMLGVDIRQALEAGFERQLSGDEALAYNAARRAYKASVVVDSAIDDATGKFSPRKLLSMVERKYGSAKNAGELGDLALASNMLENTPRMGKLGTLVAGALGGGGAASAFFNPEMAMQALPYVAGGAVAGGATHAIYRGLSRQMIKEAAGAPNVLTPLESGSKALFRSGAVNSANMLMGNP